MCGAANMMRGAANSMSWCGWRNACEVWWVDQNQSPHMAKNNFLLNECFGISMNFENIFFYFFKPGKWTFSDPAIH